MKCKREYMRLYAVTDRSWAGKQTLLKQVEAALRGGVTCVQLREKNLDKEAFYQEALEMRQLCSQYGVPFLVNDAVDIAVRCHADGVHVGQADMEAGKVRSVVGDHLMIGVSVQTVEQAIKAQDAGADYLGVGAVFKTTSKMDAAEVSLKTLAEICAAVRIPVVAIGGIGKHNLRELSGTGVDGVACISAIFAAKDIEKECKLLREELGDENSTFHSRE